MYQTNTPGMIALIRLQDDSIAPDVPGNNSPGMIALIDYRMIALPQMYLVTTLGLQNQSIDCPWG
jgi:hypothetical protein